MPAIDVSRRIEPGTVAMLDTLARWDLTNIDTIRTSYGAVGPAPVAPKPEVERRDETIPGSDGHPDVAVRWYRPAGAQSPSPTMLWLHGGAFIMGTLDENDDRLDRLVMETGCAVVSVEWRLAPENPYPAGLHDAASVYAAIAGDPGRYSVDPDRIAIGGASAGAGLAAGLCLYLRENGLPQPVLQLLIYPMLDDRELTPSIRAIEDPGHWGLWHLRANRLVWAAYLAELSGGEVPPTAAPARASDLTGLAPAFIGVGDVDAFVDENLDYAARLLRADVPVELHVYPGVIHGGFGAPPATPRTAQFLRDVYEAVRGVFAA